MKIDLLGLSILLGITFCFTLPTSTDAHSYSDGVPGGVIYQTARFGGKSVPIYGIDPSDPTYEVHGDNLALYARRDPLLGQGYWAELWMGPSSAVEAGLSPIAGTKVHFRDNISAIKGITNLRLPGTSGGDVATLQLRVWSATSLAGKSVETWSQVLEDPTAPRGKSNLAKVVLGNVSSEGKLFIPPQLAFAFEGFGLYIVPEPSACFLLAAGLGSFVLSRRRLTR